MCRARGVEVVGEAVEPSLDGIRRGRAAVATKGAEADAIEGPEDAEGYPYAYGRHSWLRYECGTFGDCIEMKETLRPSEAQLKNCKDDEEGGKEKGMARDKK